MAILYEDSVLVCDDDAITIKTYYFPVGSKRIPYADIRHVEPFTMGAMTGKYRIWGMGLSPHWFHLDVARPRKTEALLLDVGALIKPIITPDDCSAVHAILKEKTIR